MIACISSEVRDAVQDLADIDKLLYSADDEGHLDHALGQVDLDVAATLPARLPELKEALRRNQGIKTHLISMGYRDFVQA